MVTIMRWYHNGVMRTDINLGLTIDLSVVTKSYVTLYRSGLCNKVVIKYALVIFGT